MPFPRLPVALSEMTDHFDPIPRDDVMSPSYSVTAPLRVSTNHVLLVIDVLQLPIELQDGVSKIIKYAPHKNLVSESSMQENGAEYKWHIK